MFSEKCETDGVPWSSLQPHYAFPLNFLNSSCIHRDWQIQDWIITANSVTGSVLGFSLTSEQMAQLFNFDFITLVSSSPQRYPILKSPNLHFSTLQSICNFAIPFFILTLCLLSLQMHFIPRVEQSDIPPFLPDSWQQSPFGDPTISPSVLIQSLSLCMERNLISSSSNQHLPGLPPFFSLPVLTLKPPRTNPTHFLHTSWPGICPTPSYWPPLGFLLVTSSCKMLSYLCLGLLIWPQILSFSRKDTDDEGMFIYNV